MSDRSHFKSRSGTLKSSPEECFHFVTDIRNFEKLIPEGSIANWQAEEASCSFSVPMIGTVSFNIFQKTEYSKVVFKGDALKKNDFELVLHINENSNNLAEVKVELMADLNPMMKMVAVRPIAQFLEMLIAEMENFSGWKGI